jgi:hypothetical protein
LPGLVGRIRCNHFDRRNKIGSFLERDDSRRMNLSCSPNEPRIAPNEAKSAPRTNPGSRRTKPNPLPERTQEPAPNEPEMVPRTNPGPHMVCTQERSPNEPRSPRRTNRIAIESCGLLCRTNSQAQNEIGASKGRQEPAQTGPGDVPRTNPGTGHGATARRQVGDREAWSILSMNN